jgi:hypothetical protein
MTKTYKKIIAREFLYLLFTTVLGILILICTVYLNAYYRQCSFSKRNEAFDLIDAKDIPIRLRFFLFVNQPLDMHDEIYWFGSEDFIAEMKVRDNSDYYSLLVSNGHFVASSKEQFQKMILEDVSSEEYLALIKLKFRESEEYTCKQICDSQGEMIDMWTILFLLLFALRYLIYATVWSIHTLKN